MVGKLKYTNGLQPVSSRWNLYFKEHLIEAAFEAVLIIIEIELAPD